MIEKKSYRYFVFHKPFGVLCQFTDPVGGKSTLADFAIFPKDVYPVGRLDEDSEGLLILTNDPKVNSVITGSHIEKEYWVQVEGVPCEIDLMKFHKGIELNIRGKIEKCLPAFAEILSNQNPFPDRYPPIRTRKLIPTTWILVKIREGKNRQVRKMTASIGFPTLRLVRHKVGHLDLGNMHPGEWKEIQEKKLLLQFNQTNSSGGMKAGERTKRTLTILERKRNKTNGNKISK